MDDKYHFYSDIIDAECLKEEDINRLKGFICSHDLNMDDHTSVNDLRTVLNLGVNFGDPHSIDLGINATPKESH